MEVETKTRDKIILESLNLFSKKGYEGVSMRDIAAAVGIKGASIYNHFKGKEEIFNAIVDKMSTKYDTEAMLLQMPSNDDDTIIDFYTNITIEHLLELASGLFTFYVSDDFANKFRKMLIMEQYRNELARDTLKRYFFDIPIDFQSKLFKQMIEKRAFFSCDSRIMAIHFYAPIFYLLNKNDIENNLEHTLQILKDHVFQFSRLYKNEISYK